MDRGPKLKELPPLSVPTYRMSNGEQNAGLCSSLSKQLFRDQPSAELCTAGKYVNIRLGLFTKPSGKSSWELLLASGIVIVVAVADIFQHSGPAEQGEGENDEGELLHLSL